MQAVRTRPTLGDPRFLPPRAWCVCAVLPLMFGVNTPAQGVADTAPRRQHECALEEKC